MGERGLILYGTIDNGAMVQCIMSGIESNKQGEAQTDRKRLLDRGYLNEAFMAWMDGPIAPGAIDVGLPAFFIWYMLR